MRISDWSSDVCSSDLGCGSGRAGWRPRSVSIHGPCGFPNRGQSVSCRAMTGNASGQGHDGFSGLVVAGPTARDRKSGVEGKSVSVRVDLGGCRFNKKKNKKYNIMIAITKYTKH